MPSVSYSINTASAQTIADHLVQCDARFQPALSRRLNISEYAAKLHAHAERFEAWSEEGRLIGLVAAYCNDMASRVAFITSVSVLQAFEGQGIASKLVQQCVVHVKKSAMMEIRLEVSEANQAARMLYQRHGFESEPLGAGTNGTQETLHMRLTL